MKLLSLFGLGLAGLTTAAPAGEFQPIEVAGVNRRGIAFNQLEFTNLFITQNRKTTWMYNWDSRIVDFNRPHEFVPMLHSDRPDHTGPWFDNVDRCTRAGPGATHVLSFNEPDQCDHGGSCMQDIGRTIAAHRQWIEPLRKYGPKVYIGSPAVTNGVRDAITGSIMGLGYLKAFLDGCQGCKIDFINIHWYDSANNVPYFKKHIEDARQIAGGRPIWITEFAPFGTEQEIQRFLQEVLPWLDSQPDVHRYALFMARQGSMVNDVGNGLSNIGRLFNEY